MDIVSTFAPPRYCELGGTPFWIRPFTLEDFATLLAWLDDVLEGRAERKTPPALGSPEAQAAIESTRGFVVLAWIALRHHGVTWSEAADHAVGATEQEKARLFDVLFARRRYMVRGGGGEDLAEAWWGPNVIALGERFHQSMERIGKLTLDQLDCYATNGAEDEDPSVLTVDEMQARWEAAQAEKNGATEPVGVDE